MTNKSKFVQEKYCFRNEKEILETFKIDVSREKHLKWWVDREEELDIWRNIIKESVTLNKNYIVFIIGSYGRGKTLSLLKVIEEAEKYREIISIYLTFKGEEKTKPGVDFIFRIFRNIDFYKLTIGKTEKELKNAIKNIPNNFDETKNILNKIYFGKTGRTQQKLFDNEDRTPRIKESEISKLSLFFLRGEIKPTVSQLKQLEVLRKIENIDIAKEYLAAILCFMKNLGYNTFLLAFDEFEYLSLVNKSQRVIYIALLRGLYDFPIGIDIKAEEIANMSFFIAISEDGWSNLKETEKREVKIGGPTVPLLDRVDAATTLSVFDRNQTCELIKERLRYNRIEERFEDDPLIPFTEDFVDFIYGKTGGEPRAIVVRCGQVLDAGLAERVLLLNEEFAQRVLEDRGF